MVLVAARFNEADVIEMGSFDKAILRKHIGDGCLDNKFASDIWQVEIRALELFEKSRPKTECIMKRIAMLRAALVPGKIAAYDALSMLSRLPIIELEKHLDLIVPLFMDNTRIVRSAALFAVNQMPPTVLGRIRNELTKSKDDSLEKGDAQFAKCAEHARILLRKAA